MLKVVQTLRTDPSSWISRLSGDLIGHYFGRYLHTLSANQNRAVKTLVVPGYPNLTAEAIACSSQHIAVLYCIGALGDGCSHGIGLFERLSGNFLWLIQGDGQGNLAYYSKIAVNDNYIIVCGHGSNGYVFDLDGKLLSQGPLDSSFVTNQRGESVKACKVVGGQSVIINDHEKIDCPPGFLPHKDIILAINNRTDVCVAQDNLVGIYLDDQFITWAASSPDKIVSIAIDDQREVILVYDGFLAIYDFNGQLIYRYDRHIRGLVTMDGFIYLACKNGQVKILE